MPTIANRTLLFFLCCLAILNATAQQRPRDSFSVFFRLNEPGLDAAATQRLDRLVYNGLLHEKQRLQIVGFADYVGGNLYNDTLSLQRARAVRDYLVGELSLPPGNISLYTGRGEIARTDTVSREGNAPDRRVDILINRPQLPNPPAASAEPPTTVSTGTSISIDKLKENETLQLNNLFFYIQSHRFKDSSFVVLEDLVRLLRQNPRLEISIEGHICCYRAGPDAYDIDSRDFTLSVNRAKAVYQYLVQNGVDPRRLRYSGFGRSRPAVPIERTEADAQKNRRVEIRVIRR